jgi:hypothetical protein
MTTEGEEPLELEDMRPEQVAEALSTGDISIEEVRENEDLRRRINRSIVLWDMEQHSEIYERLAEV